MQVKTASFLPCGRINHYGESVSQGTSDNWLSPRRRWGLTIPLIHDFGMSFCIHSMPPTCSMRYPGRTSGKGRIILIDQVRPSVKNVVEAERATLPISQRDCLPQRIVLEIQWHNYIPYFLFKETIADPMHLPRRCWRVIGKIRDTDRATVDLSSVARALRYIHSSACLGKVLLGTGNTRTRAGEYNVYIPGSVVVQRYC